MMAPLQPGLIYIIYMAASGKIWTSKKNKIWWICLFFCCDCQKMPEMYDNIIGDLGR